ncbi:hypothetical protein [Oerskovia sp. Root22]|uniref:hypothetical protein n=1 Tax=Oerskovia sp. Root22 TaxID=1736494 RepID=UPI000700999D|nr:hypothetical protein [Oerskovia sp. Root22]KRC37528.1 hypothetical protein ASE15_05285 [Oerskovia sp. Root22]
METEKSPELAAAHARQNKGLLIAAAVLAVVILAIFVVVRVNDARAQDRRTDEYWCTLSGASPLDRAPNTGELCIDL